MASLLSLNGLSLAFGGEPLLDNVSLNINKGDHICLVGRNGSGKSSFLKLLSGELEPDSGEIIFSPALSIAYLPQDVPTEISGTVIEVVSGIIPIRPGEKNKMANLSLAKSAISRLGLNNDDIFMNLSGGQRRRALLARAIASEPDLLILDEPTNHLDIATIEWLESFLEKRISTYIFVTHDRTFLRKCAKRIVDLDLGKLNGWDCDYDTFLRRKQQVLEDEEAVYERMGKLLKREEAWLRQGVKARTRRNQGRVRALMELRERFGNRRMEEGNAKMDLISSERSGARVLRMKNLTFSYPGESPLINDFSMDILRGERIGIIGPNGAGKSTLVKLLMEELSPTSGEVIQGTNLSIVYFDQLREQLKPELSVQDNLSDGRDTVNVGGSSRHVLSYLSDFLFSPERARTPVKALSGGERSRLLLARLFLKPCNLLILDEPTNDLDIETLDLLEEQLSTFPGTVLLISHDRAFLDDVVTSTLVFEDGTINQYPGGYSDWLAAKTKRAKNESRPIEQQSTTRPKTTTSAKLSYKEKREHEELPKKIEALEKEEAELNAKLSDPLVFKEAPQDILSWQSRLDAIPSEIEALMTRWAELDERV